MRYIDVTDDFVAQVLKANHLQEAEKIEETKKVEKPEEVNEEVTEAEHVCPLCESELDGPIPEEALQECVDYILHTINEALEEGGEDLSESEDEDFDDEETEE